MNRNVLKIKENVYWIGARDWNRRIFDALIPLPKGTSYNAYLIIGNKSKALIDTVNPGFEEELEEKIRSLIPLEDLDYVIMNHAEPDHAGAIPYIMKIASKAKLITSNKGAKMAQIYYNIPQERIIIIKDNDTISLGDKTLRFIEAPMLHWPETIFTYLEEDGILFPCDFFGAHLANGIYSDEIEDYLVHAQRYWGEIMMPFRIMAQKALEKIANLNINIIAPSHGPIHRRPEIILNAYERWAYGETNQKVTIAYVSMWNNTDTMVKQIADTLLSEGIEVTFHNLVVADIGDIAKDLVDSRAIVLGAPTVLGGAHPLAVYATYLLKALRPPIKFAIILSSYGWGGGAIRQIQEILNGFKIDIVGTLEINGPPTEENIQQIIKIAKDLAKKIKEG
ncbi:MAG: FprA family A-type flavoprotein [Candidatus Methanomethylicota archaeon]|jgi:flavorubredoxin|uniref:FprA family A-type flavoprotein n=1 Tax=Thermoproteota archaeon TaxID=2056631 RepID=A0A520KDY5_9CREN|nr:MAG: FprA family A-type flavoprotein [Candidatus Verstraetearchaeota archaeon]TDA38845.1 MAG: FprA family A-type flavoprotein [Candidatus Verstraetearchaeota archaeon]